MSTPQYPNSYREEFDTCLRSLAGAIIAKAMDFSHMHIIAMAEVYKMNTIMEELLVTVFKLDHLEIHFVSE